MKATRAVVSLLPFLLAAVQAQAQYALVNQAGYLPDREKKVYFITVEDTFYVVDRASGQTVFRGPVVLTSTKDPSAGIRTSVGDFSSFTQEGTFQISTPNADTSYSFSISKTVFEDVYRKALKGFYYQRCGSALSSQQAGVYARSTCHTTDGLFHSSTGQTGSLAAQGGWHDAGDYGKYVVNAGISVGTLLMAYELYPAKFRYDDLNIPESGNSVPDILDEVRYELDWLLEMQDTTDGGVYFKETTLNFPGFIMPNQDNAALYIYQKSTTATGDFAAVMAMAARIYQPFDAVYAARCLTAAQRAWGYLSANPTIVPVGGFRNPSGTGTGEYGDNNDSDERLWAAAEVYETTGDTTCHAYYLGNYLSSVFSSTMGWADVRDMAHIAYLTGKQAGASVTVKNTLRTGLLNYCAQRAGVVATDGLNVSALPTEYGWGSNGFILNNAVLMIVGYTESNDTTLYNAALEQLNYALGCNRIDISFVTGVGEAHTMNPHHRPSYADGIVEPIPGLLAGGPDHGLDDAILQSLYTSATAPARCYTDNWQSYASNEIAINWNAPLVFVSGFFNESPLTSVQPPPSVAPRSFTLLQNYPNPFNPTTAISYQLSAGSEVSLKVYDILGRLVVTLVQGRQSAGTYRVTFNAKGLTSGVYFYRLEAGDRSLTRKMVVLK